MFIFSIMITQTKSIIMNKSINKKSWNVASKAIKKFTRPYKNNMISSKSAPLTKVVLKHENSVWVELYGLVQKYLKIKV